MHFKNFLIPIFILIFSVTVLAVEQNVTVNILLVPEIFLGDNISGNDTTDSDGTVFATLSNNGADICQINWGRGFRTIHPLTTHANNTYFRPGNKTVEYRCRLFGQNFITTKDIINVLNAPQLIYLIQPTPISYNEKKILIDILINTIFVDLEYQIDNSKSMHLCTDCNIYNKTKSFKDGYHNLTIIAKDDAGELDRANVSFFVDSTEPKIRKTFPKKNKYTNGNFTIVYDELFLHNITLHYNKTLYINKLDCPPGKKQICEFNVDLSMFDNQSLSYFFGVSDTFFITKQMPPITVKVDTTKPNIEKLDYKLDRKRVEFNISISEQVDLDYYDENGKNQKWRNLCRNCDSYNKKKSFSTGEHNLIIRATDKAMNIDEEQINFFI